MRFRKSARAWNSERHWLCPTTYTGVFPLRAQALDVDSDLEKLRESRELSRIPGLRNARCTRSSGLPPCVHLELDCEANVLDALEELAEQPLPMLDAVLAHCEGFPGRTDPARWLAFARKHRIHNARPLSNRQDPFDGPLEPAAISPLEPHELEQPLAREDAVMSLTMQLHRARARRDARKRRRQGRLPAGLRGVHAKHHGLLHAVFRVREDLPRELQHGILTPGAEYEAWVRVSNGDPTPRPDWLPDVRGFALKLVGVQGPPLLDVEIPDGIPVPEGRTQDFALVTHPTFFMRDALDYLVLRSLLDARPDSVVEWFELLIGASVYGLRRPRELGILARTLLRWCRHPLQIEYHSLAAFSLGPAQAVKWSVRPTAATARALASESLATSLRGFCSNPSDFLKSALQRSVDATGDRALELEVALHLRGDRPLPVEDPTVDWDERGAHRVVVASLIIEAQDATSPQRLATAQNLVFSPWHSLAAHRPLGSLNRARLGAYLASSEERWRTNGVAGTEAAARKPERGAVRVGGRTAAASGRLN